jgi:hypothetical protein
VTRKWEPKTGVLSLDILRPLLTSCRELGLKSTADQMIVAFFGLSIWSFAQVFMSEDAQGLLIQWLGLAVTILMCLSLPISVIVKAFKAKI